MTDFYFFHYAPLIRILISLDKHDVVFARNQNGFIFEPLKLKIKDPVCLDLFGCDLHFRQIFHCRLVWIEFINIDISVAARACHELASGIYRSIFDTTTFMSWLTHDCLLGLGIENTQMRVFADAQDKLTPFKLHLIDLALELEGQSRTLESISGNSLIVS